MITFSELFKREYASARIGVFGCGCWFYWDQFKGLKEKLIGYQDYFEERLRQRGVNVVSGGLVDTPQLAAKTGDMFSPLYGLRNYKEKIKELAEQSDV